MDNKMTLITQLPPGEWSFILFETTIIAACPEHEPRIIDTVSGFVTILKPASPTIVAQQRHE